MILVFDLDDTLYDETTYVLCGFRAVAAFLEREHGITAEAGFSFMRKQLAGGRGRIFDDLLREYGIYSKERVRRCISVYRGHQPAIQLYPDAEVCLKRFETWPKYLVTDGNKRVQERKVKALGLERRFTYCYITHRYGVKNAKPSPYCFLKLCERENVQPADVVYIADNPRKDFVGIKPLGFKTVRILRGAYKDVFMGPEYEADRQIASLNELTEDFLLEIFK